MAWLVDTYQETMARDTLNSLLVWQVKSLKLIESDRYTKKVERFEDKELIKVIR